MKNATIATSRTRASSDTLLTYRPLQDEWGDADALRALRAHRTGAAGRRARSTVEPAAEPAPAPTRRPAPSGRHRSRSRSRVLAHRFGLFGLLHST